MRAWWTTCTSAFPDSGIARAVNYLPARTVVPVNDPPYHCDVAVEAVVSHGDGTPPQAIEDRHGLIIEACNTDAAPKCPLATQSVAFSHYNNISAPAAAQSVRQAHRRHRRRADRPVPRLCEGHRRVGRPRGGRHREGECVPGRHRRSCRHERGLRRLLRRPQAGPQGRGMR